MVQGFYKMICHFLIKNSHIPTYPFSISTNEYCKKDVYKRFFYNSPKLENPLIEKQLSKLQGIQCIQNSASKNRCY
jgi:hypothetical protein